MSDLSRREFIAAGTAATAAAALVGIGGPVAANSNAPEVAGAIGEELTPGRKPNMVVIMVDEMRFPMHFPRGIVNSQQFLEAYMPNLHRLTQRGVRFTNHYTAGTACSPSRASFVSGLYPHQQWCLQTRKGTNDGAASLQAPALDPGFPTYGKLLREAGYRTPWVGKWHLSDEHGDGASYLVDYGFEGLTLPDPIGTNGEGLEVDPDIAHQAVTWLTEQTPGHDPFCLTVSFVNPHDKEFFWGGTEADRYNKLFAEADQTPMVSYDQPDLLDDPATLRHRGVPRNWESTKSMENHKPACQAFSRSFTEGIWGGASDDKRERGFSLVDNPNPALTNKVAIAPYSYWARSSDAYVQVLTLVDIEIGKVIDSIPDAIAEDTIIVMTADHGDYSSAHGLLSNKVGSMYDEAVKVPLVVVDPKKQFTGSHEVARQQLTSSVDVLPMLVTMAHGGSRAWLDQRPSPVGYEGHLPPGAPMPAYSEIYGTRFDMMPVLRSSGHRGRSAVLMASDEWVPEYFVFNGARRHILGLRTSDMKIASYTNWDVVGTPDHADAELESYDYSTRHGRLELRNGKARSAKAQALVAQLHGEFDAHEMSAPLPMPYRFFQNVSKIRYLVYIAFLDALNADGTINPPDLDGLRHALANLAETHGIDIDLDLDANTVAALLARIKGSPVRDLIHLG